MAKVNLQILCTKKLLEALTTGVHSSQELSEICGFRRLTVDEYLREWHKSPNLVHIAAWKKAGPRGHVTALWSFGLYGEDAPRPTPQSKAEKNRRLRQRNAYLKERGLLKPRRKKDE